MSFCHNTTFSSTVSRYIRLHENSGHMAPVTMIRAIKSKTWHNVDLTVSQVKRASKIYSCPYCILAKRRRDPTPINVDPPDFHGLAPLFLSSKTAEPGDIISFDPQTSTPIAVDGSTNWILFKDVASGFNHVTFGTDASTETVQTACNQVFSFVQSSWLYSQVTSYRWCQICCFSYISSMASRYVECANSTFCSLRTLAKRC